MDVTSSRASTIANLLISLVEVTYSGFHLPIARFSRAFFCLQPKEYTMYRIRYRTRRGDVRTIEFDSLLAVWGFVYDIKRTLKLRPTQVAIKAPNGRFIPHCPF